MSFDCISKNNLYGVKLDLIEDKLKKKTVHKNLSKMLYSFLLNQR